MTNKYQHPQKWLLEESTRVAEEIERLTEEINRLDREKADRRGRKANNTE